MYWDANLLAVKKKPDFMPGDIVLDKHKGVFLTLGVVDSRRAFFRLSDDSKRLSSTNLPTADDDEFHVLPAEQLENKLVLLGLPVDSDSHYDLEKSPQPLILTDSGWMAVVGKRSASAEFSGFLITDGKLVTVSYWNNQMYTAWRLDFTLKGEPKPFGRWVNGAGLSWFDRSS